MHGLWYVPGDAPEEQAFCEKAVVFLPAIHYFLILLIVNILNWFKTENIRLRLRRVDQSSVA